MLLRINNKFVNAVLNNKVSRLLDRYTYGVYLFHFISIMAFTTSEEYRKTVHSSDGVDGSQMMNIFGKSYESRLQHQCFCRMLLNIHSLCSERQKWLWFLKQPSKVK
eukprot:1141783_1